MKEKIAKVFKVTVMTLLSLLAIAACVILGAKVPPSVIFGIGAAIAITIILVMFWYNFFDR